MIGLNTEKSPGDLARFAVTQTPVKNISCHWCKITLKGVNNNNNNNNNNNKDEDALLKKRPKELFSKDMHYNPYYS